MFWDYIFEGKKFGVGLNSSVGMIVMCWLIWFLSTMGVCAVGIDLTLALALTLIGSSPRCGLCATAAEVPRNPLEAPSPFLCYTHMYARCSWSWSLCRHSSTHFASNGSSSKANSDPHLILALTLTLTPGKFYAADGVLFVPARFVEDRLEGAGEDE